MKKDPKQIAFDKAIALLKKQAKGYIWALDGLIHDFEIYNDVNKKLPNDTFYVYKITHHGFLTVEILDSLIKAGFNVFQEDKIDSNILHFIAKSLSLVSLVNPLMELIESHFGIDKIKEAINKKDRFGHSMLITFIHTIHTSLIRGKEIKESAEVISNLVQKYGADVNLENIDKESPLGAYCDFNEVRLPIIRTLVKNGADFNHRNHNNMTPFHHVVNRGDLKAVKYAVEVCKADVNSIDNFGETPLIVALKFNGYDVVQYLLDKTADRNMKTDKGESIEDLVKISLDMSKEEKEKLLDFLKEEKFEKTLLHTDERGFSI